MCYQVVYPGYLYARYLGLIPARASQYLPLSVETTMGLHLESSVQTVTCKARFMITRVYGIWLCNSNRTIGRPENLKAQNLKTGNESYPQ